MEGEVKKNPQTPFDMDLEKILYYQRPFDIFWATIQIHRKEFDVRNLYPCHQ